MVLNKDQVLSFLPHRDPFLFIDTVEEITVPDDAVEKNYEGCSVIANFYADPELDIFKGHFPGRPILPGVVQVEMMAQASSFVITKIDSSVFNEDIDVELALLAVNGAKFRKPVLPGMNLKIHAVCARRRGKLMNYDCKIYCEGQLMSEASLMASTNIG